MDTKYDIIIIWTAKTNLDWHDSRRGGSSFSMASIILGMFGGIVGIILGFKLGQ